MKVLKKALKWLLLLPVAVYPYLYFVIVNPPEGTLLYDVLEWIVHVFNLNLWTFIGFTWLVGLTCALLTFLLRDHWTARELALVNMLIKLIHIPSYVVWFIFGVALVIFMGPVWAFIMDAMTIALSGLVGLIAAFCCKKEGSLTGQQTVLYGILQFIFVVDVISAIVLYCKAKKSKEATP